METVKNKWGKRIAHHKPYRVLFELHSTEANQRTEKMLAKLQSEEIDVILASSETRLSKYHTMAASDPGRQIFVVDQYDPRAKPYPLEKSTEIFQKYEKARRIDRLYVAPETFSRAETILLQSGI